MTFLKKIKFAKKIIKEYLEKYPGKCVVSVSSGKDSAVLLDLVRKVDKNVPVIAIMTPFKFKESWVQLGKLQKKYGIFTITKRDEKTDVSEWWKTEPDSCCNYYKVEPLGELLQSYDCWFAGLRRDEGATRALLEYVVQPDRFGKVKVNPILDFTEKDVWRYTALYKIPVNSMYKKGYRSLGCAPCTHKEKNEGESERAGRWTGTKKAGGECGIHSCNIQK